MSKKPGIFISFEGSEGSGKTTQIDRLASKLEERGEDVLVTREPGGTDIGEDIRHLLKHNSNGEQMCPETELLLFAASRAQLVRQIIVPALKEGKIVLCDRFLDSTTVYQGVARQLSSEPVHVINAFAVGDMQPDLTVVLDIPAEVGFQRIKHRASDLPDRMEKENIEFYKLVREGYLVLADSLPERFTVIKGDRKPDEVAIDVWQEISDRYFPDE
ncbi:MAG: dTMP kinase [Opitutales bacterium]|nr:dTMP kinase [Opitutales bacterium]